MLRTGPLDVLRTGMGYSAALERQPASLLAVDLLVTAGWARTITEPCMRPAEHGPCWGRDCCREWLGQGNPALAARNKSEDYFKIETPI